MRVLSYNTWLLPAPPLRHLPPVRRYLDHNQRARAPLIGAYVPRDVDICVFQEVFDGPSRAALLRELTHHPHQTMPLASSASGWQRFAPGGVVIASRHPIVAQAQHDFGHGVGLDQALTKGAVYAAVETPEGLVHVVGTHLQAHRSPARAATRRSQMRVMRAFVDAMNIPSTEPLMWVGDMNIHNDDTEHADMLAILDANMPTLRGNAAFTYDAKVNPLCQEDDQEFLDYVLVSNRHAAAESKSVLQVVRPQGVYGGEKNARPLSDHYGVLFDGGFVR